MAAGDIIQTKAGTVVSDDQIVLTFDSTVISGNDIVLLVGHGSDGITTPTGYTLVKTQEHLDNNQWGGIYRKKSVGTETGVTVNFASVEEGGVFMMEVEGMASSPDDKTNGSYNATSQSSIAPGSTGTLSQANEFVACIAWNWNGNEDWTINDGFSHYEIDAGSSYHALIGYVVVAATTAKDPTITFEGNDGAWAVALIASFKLSAVEQTITPGLKQQLVTTFSPTLTVGSVDIAPSREQQLVTIYDPVVIPGAVDISPSWVQQALAAFDPAITVGSVDIVPALKQQLVATYNPVLTTGAVDITPEPHPESRISAFDPVLTQSPARQYITPAITQQLASAYDPTFSREITPPLVSIGTTAFAPVLTTGPVDISPELYQSLIQVFDPTVITEEQYIDPDLVEQLVAAFNPDVTRELEIVPELAVNLISTFDPAFTTGPISFTPSLVQHLLTTFDPSIKGLWDVYPETAIQQIQAYDPTITIGATYIEPEFVQQLVQAYDPAFGGIIVPSFAQQLIVAFDPEVERLLSIIEPEFVQQLVMTFVPALFVEGTLADTVGILYITNSYDPQTHVDESYHPETFVTGDSETYIRRR